MFKIKNLLLATVLLTIPTWALSWYAWNRLEVLPVSDNAFEVIGRPGSGAAQYWCGAGDYARQVLGIPAAQRIYIWKAIGGSVNRPGYKAVQFSLTAPENVSTSPGYSLSVKATGDNLTSAFAQQYCYGNADEFCLPIGC